MGAACLRDFFIEHTYASAASVGGVGVPFDAEMMGGITEVPTIDVEPLCVYHLVLEPCIVVGGFIVIDEMGFRRGCVFTDVLLVVIIGLIVYGCTGIAGGLTWFTLVTGTISDHAEDVLGDFFWIQ